MIQDTIEDSERHRDKESRKDYLDDLVGFLLVSPPLWFQVHNCHPEPIDRFRLDTATLHAGYL